MHSDLSDAVSTLLIESSDALTKIKNKDELWTEPEIEQLSELTHFTQTSLIPLFNQDKKNPNDEALKKAVEQLHGFLPADNLTCIWGCSWTTSRRGREH